MKTIFGDIDINNFNNQIEYNKNDIIFFEGDECKNVGLIIQGEVSIVTSSCLSNEFLISNITQGNIFGNNILLSDSPFYLGSIYATKKTKIIFLSKKEYMNLVSSNLETFLKNTSNDFFLLQQRNKILLQKNIKEKIFFYLISKSKELHTKRIPVESKISLARYLNIERPSLSRELINLKKDGYIDYNNKYIEIKKEPY